VVEINVNGNPGGPQGPRGPGQGPAPDELRQRQINAAWQAHTRWQQQEWKRSERFQSDYDKAINELSKATQSRARAERQRDQQDKRADREREAQNRRETAEHFREINRRQQEAMRRGREEEMLRRTYAQMEHRTSGDLSPAGLRAAQRSGGVYQSRLASFLRRYGRTPNAPLGVNFETGLGTEEGAYAVQNIRRLGGMGARGIDQGTWGGFREAGRAAYELRRLNRVVERQERWAKSPADQASLARQITAINRARMQMGAAAQGFGPIGRMGMGLGMAAGGFGAMMANPLVAAGLATISAPWWGNRMLAGVLGLGEPYRNTMMDVNRIGRGGGFSGAGLMGEFANLGASGLIPTQGLTARARALGIGPEDVTSILGNFGVAPTSVGQGAGILENVRRQFAFGNSGLPENTIAQMFGRATAAGAVSINPTQMGGDQLRFFNELQKIMAVATAQGLDRSETARTLITLQSQTGGLTAPAGMADWFSRLAATGIPQFRQGGGVVNFSEAIAGQFSQAGTANVPSTNVMMASLLQRNPGGVPQSAESLRQFLGISGADWQTAMQEPGFRQTVTNYLDGAKSGNPQAALLALGNIIAGRPDIGAGLINRYADMTGTGPGMRAVMLQQLTGGSYTQAVGLQAAPRTAGGGFPGADMAEKQRNLIPQVAAALGLSPQQAIGVVGALTGEGLTTGNEANKPWGTGGVGLAQWTGSRRKRFNQWMAENNEDPTSPVSQEKFMAWEMANFYPDTLARMRSATSPAEASRIMTNEYLFGGDAGLIAQHGAERAGMTADLARRVGDDQTIDFLRQRAEQQGALFQSGRAMTGVQQGGLAAFDWLGGKFNELGLITEHLITAFQRLTSAAGGTGTPQTTLQWSSRGWATQNAPVR
jgi:hypothetical protein